MHVLFSTEDSLNSLDGSNSLNNKTSDADKHCDMYWHHNHP